MIIFYIYVSIITSSNAISFESTLKNKSSDHQMYNNLSDEHDLQSRNR